MVNFLDRSSLSIANTTIRAEMHLNATQMGWLLTAFSLAYGFGQLPLIGFARPGGNKKSAWRRADDLVQRTTAYRPRHQLSSVSALSRFTGSGERLPSIQPVFAA